jgi:hypothetical protein
MLENDYRDWDIATDKQPTHLKYKSTQGDDIERQVGSIFTFCNKANKETGELLYQCENKALLVKYAECENPEHYPGLFVPFIEE